MDKGHENCYGTEIADTCQTRGSHFWGVIWVASSIYIMKNSGREEAFQLVYPGNIENIMSGGAYYEALRAHFLVRRQHTKFGQRCLVTFFCLRRVY